MSSGGSSPNMLLPIGSRHFRETRKTECGSNLLRTRLGCSPHPLRSLESRMFQVEPGRPFIGVCQGEHGAFGPWRGADLQAYG